VHTFTFFLALVAAFVVLFGGSQAQNPQVTLPGLGTMEGYIGNSYITERPFNHFRGVPFASPPVGNLRFKVCFKVQFIIFYKLFYGFAIQQCNFLTYARHLSLFNRGTESWMRTPLLGTGASNKDLRARAWTLGSPLLRAWLLAGQKKKAEKIASTFKFILQMYAKKQKFILFRRKKLINFKKTVGSFSQFASTSFLPRGSVHYRIFSPLWRKQIYGT